MNLKINLLSPERKEQLAFFKVAHLAIKIGLNILFALIVFCFFLYFFLLVLKKQTEALDVTWRGLQRTESYQLIERNKKMASEYSSFAEKLDKIFSTSFSYWQVLDKIDSLLPEKVFLKEVSINGGKIIVQGKAVDREDFLVFKESLEKEEIFNNVESPISNFISSQNVDFEISFQIKNKASGK